ncbi:DUF2218 domain-containing protein [Pseudomonas sp. 5P_3.1_Bac2]|uniref:DUF2218 domain-containing protein n=1 Tax=Pseudomonas sp. 5P_3.1_Bac2 TaxID=2971617 RepID=UPI0021C5E30E|nr:DUF2218 domain-containing protein [Pseudomonas sp. 5P_3.1_Bac2]MCU1718233.1 DUF2218 domain-containing protein [Pseudomonas sp. 5P_3.1_Bac2]
MSLTRSSFVATASPARYISRLCKHFAHKVPVSFDEQQGRVEFERGLGLLKAQANGLTLSVEAADAEALEHVKAVMERHFVRVAWQEALSLSWQ